MLARNSASYERPLFSDPVSVVGYVRLSVHSTITSVLHCGASPTGLSIIAYHSNLSHSGCKTKIGRPLLMEFVR